MIVAIEDAIHAWVVAGSGLAASKVVWSQQKQPRPAAPYIAMRIGSISRFGQDWYDVRDADPVVVGAEIEQVARGVRTAVLTLQCFSDQPHSASTPAMILDGVALAARLPSVRAGLRAAQFGLLSTGQVKSIDGFPTLSVFEPRAVLECVFNFPAELVESATFIEFVDSTGTITEF